MERDVNQYMQRKVLMGSLSRRLSCECRVWHGGDFHVESCQRLQVGCKSKSEWPPRIMQKIARGSRSPFILRVDVFALSPSLHSNLPLPDRAGPLPRAARTWSSQLSRFDLHERTTSRLKPFLPVTPLQGGSEGGIQSEVIGF